MALPELSSARVQNREEALKPFLAANFDPANFLNSTLPAWSASSSTSLAEISTQAQTLTSQLNAQLSRMTNTLTQLTDDILRSGGRLAYEVEMLRGDTATLADVLTGDLSNDVQKFLPIGVDMESEKVVDGINAIETTSASTSTPEYITKLNTLAIVRDRLDTVIKVFGDAMIWDLPPSEAASSVTGMPTVTNDAELEARGRRYIEKQRDEITALVEASMQDSDEDAYNTALQRVACLRRLAVVWKGTAEEKARLQFVQALERIIEEGTGTRIQHD